LRRLRQQYSNVRWLFTGSVGLDTVARRAMLSGALLGLMPFPLEPFDGAAARAFLSYLSRERKVLSPFDLTDDGFAHLEAQLGWLSPYYLEHLANQIRPTGPLGSSGLRIATIADIDRAFDALLAPHFRLHFAAWDEHLTKNFERSEGTLLRVILNACAHSPAGEQFSTLYAILAQVHPSATTRDLREFLAVLINGGFLSEIESEPRYRFRSGLVRRYWIRYQVPDDPCSSPSTTRAA